MLALIGRSVQHTHTHTIPQDFNHVHAQCLCVCVSADGRVSRASLYRWGELKDELKQLVCAHVNIFSPDTLWMWCGCVQLRVCTSLGISACICVCEWSVVSLCVCVTLHCGMYRFILLRLELFHSFPGTSCSFVDSVIYGLVFFRHLHKHWVTLLRLQLFRFLNVRCFWNMSLINNPSLSHHLHCWTWCDDMCVCVCVCVVWLVRTWRISLIRLTCLVHTCNLTHSYKWRGILVRHDAFMRATWLIHRARCRIRDMCLCDTSHAFLCDVSHSHVRPDSFMRVTWYSCAWHDTFIRVTRLIHRARYRVRHTSLPREESRVRPVRTDINKNTHTHIQKNILVLSCQSHFRNIFDVSMCMHV